MARNNSTQQFLLEYCLENSIVEFDFTIGHESYKYRFSNIERQTEVLLVYRNRFLGYLDEALFLTAQRMKALVKKSKRLSAFALKARNRIGQ